MKKDRPEYKGKLRSISFKEAEEERMHYFLNKSVLERLEYLQHLRILNYGDQAIQPIVRKIRLLKGTKLK